jgi:hypothetical protein
VAAHDRRRHRALEHAPSKAPPISSPVSVSYSRSPLARVSRSSRNDPGSFGETRHHQAAHLRVDFLGGGLGDGLLPPHGIAEENLLLIFAIHDGAKLIGEAPARHHGAGELGRRSMSDCAPDVIFSLPKMISSETRPPMQMASREKTVAVSGWAHSAARAIQGGFLCKEDRGQLIASARMSSPCGDKGARMPWCFWTQGGAAGKPPMRRSLTTPRNNATRVHWPIWARALRSGAPEMRIKPR